MAKTQTPKTGGRKKKTRIRKQKYISLRLRLSPETSSQDSVAVDYRHHQLNLFPLHPENLYEDKDMHDENVAYLFSTDGGATTLTGLLNGVSSEEEPLSPSLNYGYSEEWESSLAKTALRSKEREASEEEEKWVSYSEVVEKKEKDEEVCSGVVAVKWCRNAVAEKGLLSLKLDYEEILNAWSDKGSLYIHGESPQIVPDVHDDILAQDGSNASNGGLWRVPEMGQREASVLRYKEKRQSRLFSKRIRYEVRKLNAEKRPRMKGRFVKRS